MLILNEQTIAKLSDPVELTDVMEKAMLAYAEGDYIMPDRSHMDFGKNTLLLMPSQHKNYFSTKIVSLCPDNINLGEPVLYGTVILNDGVSGKPLALFNGAKLTAVRTAAVGSAGVRHTSPENSSRLGVIGAGVQGLHQVIFACQNRPIKQVYLLDQSKERSEYIKSQLNGSLGDIPVKIAENSIELCENSDIIITATNSTSAVLPESEELLSGKSIVAIGSYKPEMIELPDTLFSLIDHYFIDVDIAVEESGDIIHPLAKNILKEEQIRMLSDVIRGDVKIDKSQTSIYKSVGMALFDLFTAEYLYTKAIASGLGEEVEF